MKKSEIYAIRSLLQTTARKIEFFHPNSLPLETLLKLIIELEISYDTDSPLSSAVEEDN